MPTAIVESATKIKLDLYRATEELAKISARLLHLEQLIQTSHESAAQPQLQEQLRILRIEKARAAAEQVKAIEAYDKVSADLESALNSGEMNKDTCFEAVFMTDRSLIMEGGRGGRAGKNGGAGGGGGAGAGFGAGSGGAGGGTPGSIGGTPAVNGGRGGDGAGPNGGKGGGFVILRLA